MAKMPGSDVRVVIALSGFSVVLRKGRSLTVVFYVCDFIILDDRAANAAPVSSSFPPWLVSHVFDRVALLQAASVFRGPESRPDRAEGNLYVHGSRPGRAEGALYVQPTCLGVQRNLCTVKLSRNSIY